MENQKQEITFKIKRSWFDNKERELIINPDFIQFENKNSLENNPTRFEKEDIISIRYGLVWIRGFEFTVGREYQIFIQNRNKEIIKIHFKGFYGINKKKLSEAYSDMLSYILDYYFQDILNEYVDKYDSGEELNLGDVFINKDYLKIKVAGLVKNQFKEIPWESVGVREYYSHFAVFSNKDAQNINRTFKYLDEWNSVLLLYLINAILKHKNKDKLS